MRPHFAARCHIRRRCGHVHLFWGLEFGVLDLGFGFWVFVLFVLDLGGGGWGLGVRGSGFGARSSGLGARDLRLEVRVRGLGVYIMSACEAALLSPSSGFCGSSFRAGWGGFGS